MIRPSLILFEDLFHFVTLYISQVLCRFMCCRFKVFTTTLHVILDLVVFFYFSDLLYVFSGICHLCIGKVSLVFNK